MAMLEIMYIKDLKNILAYKDTRSICDYCQRNNIEIFGTHKRRYVISKQFKRAQAEERIKDLKTKYGSCWPEVLQSEMNLCAKLQSALDSLEKSRSNTHIKQRAKPQGKIQQRFIIDCLNVLR